VFPGTSAGNIAVATPCIVLPGGGGETSPNRVAPWTEEGENEWVGRCCS